MTSKLNGQLGVLRTAVLQQPPHVDFDKSLLSDHKSPSRARDITTGPPTAFQFLGFGIVGACQSAFEVGGDFYDVIRLADDSVLLMVADVMGKGLTASVFASSLRTLVRALAHPCVSPAQLLSELNDLMFEQLSSADIFITAQLVLADLRHRHLSIACAGHCPLLISNGARRTCAMAPDGMPLGIQRHSMFVEQLAPLEPFGSALLYTDGLTEARNSAGDLFGQARLETWFAAKARDGAAAAQLKEGLLDELRSFQAGKRPVDDQTFLVLSEETTRTGALNLAQHVQVDVALLAA